MKVSSCFKSVNEPLNNQKFLVSVIFLLLGVIIPAVTLQEFNFWQNILVIIINPWFHICFLLGISLMMINVLKNFSHNYNFLTRYKNYSDVVIDASKQIFISNVIYMGIAFFFVLAFSVIFSFGQFKIIEHSYYNLSMLLYLIVYFLKFFFFYQLLGQIFLHIFMKFNEKIAFFCCIVEILLIFITPSLNVITKFKNLPLFFYSYFNGTFFANFALELTGYFVQLIFLIIIWIIIKNIHLHRRGDLT